MSIGMIQKKNAEIKIKVLLEIKQIDELDK